MKTRSHTVKSVMLAILAMVVLTHVARAQDTVKVAPKHYKVEFENDQVRVLRITYAPGEKSVMHEHPESVAVFLTDHSGKFTYPDGTTEEMPAKAGQTVWTPAGKHMGENIGDKPFELILVEFKSKNSAQSRR